MSKIIVFLNYRREDSESETRNIKNCLEQAGYKVFMDQSDIGGGERWPDAIKNGLERADVFVSIIGNKWLTCHDNFGRRRIDGANDWVRLELRTSLQAEKKVIPVLVNGAVMPPPESLPDDLKELPNRQGIRLTRENWDHDLQLLLKKIREDTSGSDSSLKIPTILMTSESPRRKELLKQIGWEEGIDYYAIHASVNLDTKVKQELTLNDAKRIAEKTAQRKINWVMEQELEISEKLGGSWRRSETIVVGVDTIVFCKNKILDRPLLRSLQFAGPKDIELARKRAKEMLMEQRGQRVHVITSLAIAVANSYQHPMTRSIVTEAEMRSYSEADIDNYIYYAEPFDKAGAFGIQEKGVSLFKGVKGSYANVVGLPLQEFISMLKEICADSFRLPELRSFLDENIAFRGLNQSVVCVGDINYDYIYDKLPDDFFSKITPPGKKIIGPIHRAVGGTAVNFAKGAGRAGFSPCYVVGVIGGDALGHEIVRELYDFDITPIYRPDPNEKTSIAIILRDTAKEDTSITLTDSHQSLPDFVVDLARDTIQKSDVCYCSGYCLTDKNRYASALKMLKIAKDANQLVVLDVVVGMSKEVPLDVLVNGPSTGKSARLVDIVVSELPEILDWFSIHRDSKNELETWDNHKDILIPILRENFPVSIIRTSKYTHEIVITSNNVIGPYPLDYGGLNANEKVGYGDFRTARQVYSFLSPRIVLASKSPQRLDLLNQIVSPSKVQVVISECDEKHLPDEIPYERVKRLAMAKAEAVFSARNYHDDIELIIGADTEIIRRDEEKDEWVMVGHPKSKQAAIRDLKTLNGKTHLAITGIAVIGKDPETGMIKRFGDCVETQVTFADLPLEQIVGYAETEEPLHRAGAYAIQGLGTMLINNLEGSFSNVVGLPLECLSEILANEFNKPIWKFDKVSNWDFPDPIKGLSQS